MDGCCRHVAATLFEIMDFQQDHVISSVTSGKCSWIKRSKQSTEAMSATGLQISIECKDLSENHPSDTFNPIPNCTTTTSFYNAMNAMMTGFAERTV